MVAEILAGLALVKSASEAISSCKDISQIAGHLDKLLTGAEQCKKKQKKNTLGGRWQSVLQSKLNDDGDETSISTIAQEKIDAALAEEAIQKAKLQITRRFGPDVWTDIIMTRDERLEKKKTAEEKAVIRKKEMMDKIYIVARNFLFLIGAIVAGISYVLHRMKGG